MKNLIKCIVILVIALMLLNIASVGYAQDMKSKLLRGFANMFTGWMEVPKNVTEVTKSDGAVAGIFIGIPKGLCMTIIRTGFGGFEAVTFFLPVPNGYNPILEPEFLFEKK